MSLENKEYREKECKTLDEHFELYDYDYSNFDYVRVYEGISERSYINAFETVDDYRFRKEMEDNPDERRLSDSEFIALIGYVTYCNEKHQEAFIDKFINDMIKLDIPDELELLLPLSKYYDVLYFESDEIVKKIKEYIEKYVSYNNENDRSFDKIKKVVDRIVYKKESVYPYVDQEEALFDYSVFLNQQKDRCELYKKAQINKLAEHLSKYQFSEISDFTRELRWILPYINYDTDYILSNFPDMELVKKDYESLHGKLIVPYSVSLYKDYLLDKDKFNKLNNDLGTYSIHRIGEIPVPFTKEEFLLGIHDDIDKNQVIELEGKMNSSRVY